MRILLLALLLQPPAAPAPDVEVEPALREAVERFFATQEAEDADGYLALWSARATRPQPEQLRFIFDNGDDRFADLTILRAHVTGDTARLRVRITRQRTDLRVKEPDGTPRTFTTPLQLSLTFVRDDGAWKLLREGPPLDDLATALLETQDPDARQALLGADRDLLTVQLFESVSRRADAFVREGKHADAQVVYERTLEVARALNDRKLEGQALQNVANALYYQRKFPESRALYERRLELETAAGHEDGIASALVGIATIQYSTYEYRPALATYRQALEIQERLDDQLLIGSTLISTGSIHYLHGEYDLAIGDYRRAVTLKRKFYDRAGAASALEGLARVYAAQGDFASALSALTAALEDRRKLNALGQQGLVLHSVGDINLRLGNLDQARAAFAEARTIFEKGKEPAAAGRALQGTALTELVAGRAALGEKAYIDSIAACTAGADPGCVAVAQAGLGFALAAQRKYDGAVEWYRKAIAGFTALDYAEQAARAQIGLADALTGNGDHDAGYEEAVGARRTAVALQNQDVLWRALVAQARAERKLGRADAALGAARAAVLTVREMAAAALDRPTLTVSRDTTAAFAAAAVLQAETGDAGGAFETAEAMRAHALRLWLAPHEREIARGMTEEERAGERTLTVELTSLLIRRDRESKLAKPDPASLARLDEAITQTIAARSDARERLFARLPELRVWRGLSPAATLEDLDAVLDDPSRALLAFVVDDHDLVVIAARRTPDGEAPQIVAQVMPAARQSLGETIARVLDPAVLADAAAWRKGAPDLFFAMLPPAAVEIVAAATRVIVMPDDLLWRVPFEAMPVEGRVLADRAIVTYAASLRPSPATPPGASDTAAAAPALLVGPPDIPVAVVEALKVTAPAWTLRPADAARAETQTIAALFDDPPARSLTGSDATPAAVKEALAAAAVVHLTGPFRVNSAAPLFSSLLLAERKEEGRESTAGDSRLELRQVFDLGLAASVIVVTDPAALSMRDSAAALAPVAWTWRAAGAPALVLRRWGGDPAPATTLVARFHEELRRGAPPADALHAAAAAVRANPSSRAPAAWAGWLPIVAR